MNVTTLRKPCADLRKMFVAVIFANGKDDDLLGLAAAVENEPVQFDEHVYMPGEDILIERRHIILSKGLWFALARGELPADPENWLVLWPHSGGSRTIIIQDCLLEGRSS